MISCLSYFLSFNTYDSIDLHIIWYSHDSFNQVEGLAKENTHKIIFVHIICSVSSITNNFALFFEYFDYYMNSYASYNVLQA